MIASDGRHQLLATRGLFTLKVKVPRGPPGGTFEWLLQPPDNGSAAEATWFIDGAVYDEAKRYARRFGFGVVVVSSAGDLVAFGKGVLPSWIVDAEGAELWALVTAASCNPSLPRVVTDCKGILDTLLQGCPLHACGPKRALARTWHILSQALDEDFRPAAKLVVWMPSHESARAIGSACDSNGNPITPTMWRANRMADVLAKAAALQNRLPEWATKLVASATLLARHRAAQLGFVTQLANNFESTRMVDEGAIVKQVLRHSTADRPQFSHKRLGGPQLVQPQRASRLPQLASPWTGPLLERLSASSSTCQLEPIRLVRLRTSRTNDLAEAMSKKRRALLTTEQQ